MKKNNKKGFTLAELLIVVAIIAVLVAIAIPVFTRQLESSREGTDAANIRNEYAQIMTEVLMDTGTAIASTNHDVELQQKTSGWQNTDVLSGLMALENSTNVSGDTSVIFNDINTVTSGKKVGFTYTAPTADANGIINITVH